MKAAFLKMERIDRVHSGDTLNIPRWVPVQSDRISWPRLEARHFIVTQVFPRRKAVMVVPV